MKLEKTDVKNIFIWSRGKNRDIYGKPYYAYVCRINLTDGCEITFNCPMSWGSSGAYDVFVKVSQELSVKFGIYLTYDDVRSGFVIQNHKQVKTKSALEHPERWRLAQVNAYFDDFCARCGMVISPERESVRNAAENAK